MLLSEDVLVMVVDKATTMRLAELAKLVLESLHRDAPLDERKDNTKHAFHVSFAHSPSLFIIPFVFEQSISTYVISAATVAGPTGPFVDPRH